jgi:hypothetical protein
MSKNKSCGNCKHFKDEDAEGWGWCTFNKTKTHCAQYWNCHNSTFNGWTEITPDNIEYIYYNRYSIVIMNRSRWDYMVTCHNATMKILRLYANRGGYYYYVLPELRIE